jgi:hypothetical protein
MELSGLNNPHNGSSLYEVTKLEKTLNITLSDSYKIFLLSGKYLSITKKCFPRKPDVFPQGLGIDYFVNIDGILKYHTEYMDEEVKEAELLLIGQGWIGGGIICIGIGAENLGQIYVFNWDFGPTFQAENLDEFLNSLHDCE